MSTEAWVIGLAVPLLLAGVTWIWKLSAALAKLKSGDREDDPLTLMATQVAELHKWHNHPLDGYDGEVMNWWVTKDLRQGLSDIAEGQSELAQAMGDLITLVKDQKHDG